MLRVLTFSVLITIAAQAAHGQSGPGVVVPAITATPESRDGHDQLALTVLGSDQRREKPVLSYTWSAAGPAPVTFSGNGTNGSKNATAIFQKAGTYTP